MEIWTLNSADLKLCVRKERQAKTKLCVLYCGRHNVPPPPASGDKIWLIFGHGIYPSGDLDL